MREILFRAKQKNNGEWVEGYYVKGATRHCIVKSLAGSPCYDVLPETIGQYTGLTDKNSKKIFEGDIVKYKANATYLGKYLECIGQVEYNEKTASFAVNSKDNIGAKNYDYFPIKFEVIGNIHDNPELLEGGDNNA